MKVIVLPMYIYTLYFKSDWSVKTELNYFNLKAQKISECVIPVH